MEVLLSLALYLSVPSVGFLEKSTPETRIQLLFCMEASTVSLLGPIVLFRAGSCWRFASAAVRILPDLFMVTKRHFRIGSKFLSCFGPCSVSTTFLIVPSSL